MRPNTAENADIFYPTERKTIVSGDAAFPNVFIALHFFNTKGLVPGIGKKERELLVGSRSYSAGKTGVIPVKARSGLKLHPVCPWR